ncbi:MAG: hypothetical protein ACI9G9_000295 [Psychromonas sp.]|jgi:hypothetical protein
MHKLLTILVLFLFSVSYSSAQVDWNKLSFEMYGEVYYAKEVQEFSNFKPIFGNFNERPYFLYNHTRKNEVNLNLGLLKAKYVDSNLRAKFGIMAGTYALRNLAGEPIGLRSIYDANIGLKLAKNHNFWLDAGIFESHLGAESAIGTKNLTLTRSLIAENSPYYETGLKLGYKTKNKAWYFSAMALNGWQQIYRSDNLDGVAYGGQINFKASKNFELNYSNFYQNYVNINSKFRYFNNFYGKFKFKKGTSVLVGFDYGIQNKEEWTGFLLIIQQKFNKNAVNLRLESFDDNSQNILGSATFDIPIATRNLAGISIGYDRYINKFTTFRLESRWLTSNQAVFYSFNGVSNLAFTGSLCFYLK